MKFEPGNKVKYKDEIGTPIDDNGESIFIVYAIYSDTEVSLGLRDYPDVEQDYTININDIVHAN